MRRLDSHRWRALLLLLLLGFTVLSLHVSMHTQPDQQSCELCGGHAKPSHAVAASPAMPLLVATAAPLPSFVPKTQPTATLIAYRQRAPPLPD